MQFDKAQKKHFYHTMSYTVKPFIHEVITKFSL